MKLIPAIVTMLVMFLTLPSIVSANQVLFFDDFNDGDASGWQIVRSAQSADPSLPCMNKNEPSTWHIKSGELGYIIDGPSCISEIIPLDLDLSAVSSFEYSFDWRLSESTHMDRNGLFLWKDANNWYNIKLLDDSIKIEKVVNGKEVILPQSSSYFPFEADQQYHFVVRITPSLLKILIDDREILNVNETGPRIENYKTAGLKATTGSIPRSVSYFDNFKVVALDDTPQTPISVLLNVPFYSQRDPLWAKDIYDHGTSWSDTPTMERWGCLTTSIAMLLHFYDINQLPDQGPLTPQSLNQWLQSQPDGYVGNGLVNWIAVTRLVRILNTAFGTTKLEYRRHAENPQAIALDTLLNKQQPVILEKPGHFMVGKGVTKDKHDVIINDPFYPHQLFSEHNQDLLSTRTLTPSNTDLSYIMAIADEGVSFEMIDENQHPVGELFTETTADKVSPEVKISHQKFELAKPDDGSYSLKITGPSNSKVSIYLYDVEANLTSSHSFNLTQPQHLLQLDFKKNGPSTITEHSSTKIAQLQELLIAGLANNQFKRSSVYYQLSRILEPALSIDATQADTNDQLLRIILSFEQTLKKYRRLLASQLYASLQTTLTEIKSSLIVD